MVSCEGPTPGSKSTGAGVDYRRWGEDRARLVQCGASKDLLIGYTLEKDKIIETFIAGAR